MTSILPEDVYAENLHDSTFEGLGLSREEIRRMKERIKANPFYKDYLPTEKVKKLIFEDRDHVIYIEGEEYAKLVNYYDSAEVVGKLKKQGKKADRLASIFIYEEHVRLDNGWGTTWWIESLDGSPYKSTEEVREDIMKGKLKREFIDFILRHGKKHKIAIRP